MAEQLSNYLLYLRSTRFGHVATTTNDVMGFDADDDEDMHGLGMVSWGLWYDATLDRNAERAEKHADGARREGGHVDGALEINMWAGWNSFGPRCHSSLMT